MKILLSSSKDCPNDPKAPTIEIPHDPEKLKEIFSKLMERSGCQ